MKKRIIISTIILILNSLFIMVLVFISSKNKCTSVRSYYCDKLIIKYNSWFVSNNIDELSPEININNFHHWQLLSYDDSTIQYIVKDNSSKPENIKVYKTNLNNLNQWINSLFVLARDESGNIWFDYVLVEKP